MNSEKPFWETSYTKAGSPATFSSGKPSWDVVEVLENRLTKGRVLDIGCGDGRNAIYAAKLGYDVTATDISEAGISKVKRLATESGLSINSYVQDMRDFEPTDSYDVIVSHGCLHLLLRDEWLKVLHNIQTATTANGYNITLVFTNKIPPSDDMEPFMKGLFNESELFNLYKGWTIHHQSSHTIEDDHGGGIRHVHAINRIIAQKTATSL